jgi:hypothetical protein
MHLPDALLRFTNQSILIVPRAVRIHRSEKMRSFNDPGYQLTTSFELSDRRRQCSESQEFAAISEMCVYGVGLWT